jgi:hypothetical protein
MSGDDITDRVLEGGEYKRAKATVRQTFSIPLGTKITGAVAGLLFAVPLAPAVVLRRELIVAYEGTDSLELIIGRLVLLGVGTVFPAGLLLVRQQYHLADGSVTAERARRLVRFEDLLMWFVLLGSVFILIGTVLAGVALVSTGAVERLYDAGIGIYRPTATFGIDVRLVSALAGVLALVLSALRWLASRAE